jgi:hypothetical protein
MNDIVVDKVTKQLRGLPTEMQWRVLEFTRALAVSEPRGIPGQQLLAYADTILPVDLTRMNQAIEQGCEQVDADAW